MPEPVLRAEGFSYSYPGALPALRDLSLELVAGEMCVVCGESGSGKSTLIRAASGLVPHFHGGNVTGSLTVGGLSVRDHGPSELAAVSGTVLQDPETQVVMTGVRAEIALPLEHRGEPPAAVARAVEEVALALGITTLLDRRTETLSGGELQRVALAAALAGRPPLLLLDEPTSQLDPVAGDELLSLLRRLNEDWGTTIVIAEHRLERCLPAADRVLALDAGRLACDSPPEGFLDWAASASPDLLPPAARLFTLAGLRPLPPSVKAARAALAGASLGPAAKEAPPASALASEPPSDSSATGAPLGATGAPSEPAAVERLRADGHGRYGGTGPLGRLRLRRRNGGARPALALHDVWHELEDGPAILRGVDLRLRPGERVALMGRNGAGKSTLLRHARGLAEPTRGHVERSGPVALLLQHPGDYLIHDRCADEVEGDGLAAAGLADRRDSDPRDLSGGERQRLALEIVLAGHVPAALCLDEPTRGMDPRRKRELAHRLGDIAAAGAAVVVATHDTGFAAEVGARVVLLGQGAVIADGPAPEVLAGGWHFATEVARVLGGDGGALTPEQGAGLLEKELMG